MTVIILGANGHIGRNLVEQFSKEHTVYAYARNFSYNIDNVFHKPIEEFGAVLNATILINCIGIGTPKKAETLSNSIYDVELEWNAKCLSYINKNPNMYYFYLSSGAARYPFNDGSIYSKTKNEIEYINAGYARTFNLRVFSFLSKYIDLDSGYFITDIIKAIKEHKTFVTTESILVRDYLSPIDFYNFIVYIYQNKDTMIKTIELYSKEPIEKKEVLEYFKNKYGLSYRLEGRNAFTYKSVYVNYHYLSEFEPSKTSIEAIEETASFFLSNGGVNA